MSEEVMMSREYTRSPQQPLMPRHGPRIRGDQEWPRSSDASQTEKAKLSGSHIPIARSSVRIRNPREWAVANVTHHK